MILKIFITIFTILVVLNLTRLYINYWKARYSKVLSQKKSSEVILGQISETLAPFLETFPNEDEDIKDLNFLGNPIDYVLWGKDKVVFIEVKSGKSRLSKKQRRIKKLIKGGKVDFVTHRIPEKIKK